VKCHTSNIIIILATARLLVSGLKVSDFMCYIILDLYYVTSDVKYVLGGARASRSAG